MGLKEQIAKDLANVLNTNEFGESIIYTQYGQSPKLIVAIVDRNPLNKFGETQETLGDELQITISRKDVPAINRDGDKVTISANFGGASKTYTVRQIMSQDEASFTVKVM